MAQHPLPIASYRLSAPTASSSILLNCFVEQSPKPGGKQPTLLRRAPGIALLVEPMAEGLPIGTTVRGMCVMGDSLYALIGETVVKIEDNWTYSFAGTVPGSERVRVQTNGTHVVFVRPSDNTGYACDGASTTQITDPVFLGFGAADVDYLDGYLIFRVPDSQQFFNSGLNALTFNALDVASAEAAPDNLMGLLVDHREIFLPGVSTSELWYDAANETGSPFARSPDGFLTYGMAATAARGSQDNSIFWLANDLTIRRLASNVPQKVSQYGIDGLLARMSVSDCYCLSYTLEGHVFIAFNFQFEGRTLVFDCSTGEWHERSSLGYGAWRPSCIVNFAGKQVVGDLQSGKIGYLDPDSFEEFGEPQKCAFQFQPIYAERNKFQLRRFELALNAGNGTTTGQGQNPLATLFKSRDSGNTFTAMPMRSLGARGNYTARAVWWNLGASRDMVLRVEVTDPVPLFAVDALVEAPGGRW